VDFKRFWLLLFVLQAGLPSIALAQWDWRNWSVDNWFSSEEAPWTGSLATGVNGRSGNANTMDYNLNLLANRDTSINTTNVIGNYFYGRANSNTVNDRAFAQLRRERKLNDVWSLYFQGALEYDRFKDFDYRIALHSGFSRQIYKHDTGFWKVRLGAGASREIGGSSDEWIPELQIGTDWEHQLTETTKLFAIFDYYPSFTDFGDFRLVSNCGLNFLVDAPRNISFRLFAQNRYDSTPVAGNNSNDIDYGAALSFGF
jgi:putative salt-induced outer membrane protein YdiY